MKRQYVLLLFAFFLMLDLSDGDDSKTLIAATKKKQEVHFTCEGGKWGETGETENPLNLKYEDADSGTYLCTKSEKKQLMLVRFRTCDNCMEVNAYSLTAIVVGNVLATALVGWAVYSISAQPKSKNISRNQASDKMNLINNGEGSTYQELNTVDKSEYSRLGGVRQKH